MEILLGTEAIIHGLAKGALPGQINARPLTQIAVSAVSLAWIGADIELNKDPAERDRYRTNLRHLRAYLEERGATVVGLALPALEAWQRLLILDLTDETSDKMPIEERLVAATALALNLAYVAPARGWNGRLRQEGLKLEELV